MIVSTAGSHIDMQTSVKIVHKFSEGLVSSTFTFGHLIVTSGDTKASSKRQGMFAFILYATFLFFFFFEFPLY